MSAVEGDAEGAGPAGPGVLSEVLRFSTRHWAPILAALTAIAFLSGLAYHKGYLGRFGFDSLVFSLPFETYFAVGALCVAVALLVTTLVALVALSVAPWIARGADAGRAGPAAGAWARLRDLSPAPRLAALAFFSIVCFIYVWGWLAPVEALLLFRLPAGARLVALWVAAPLLVLALAVVLASARGPLAPVLALAMLFAWTPVVGLTFGQHRADAVIEDGGGQPRALVWWTADAGAPEEYVLVHQDGSLLYLVELAFDAQGGRAFRSVALDLHDVHRVVYVRP